MLAILFKNLAIFSKCWPFFKKWSFFQKFGHFFQKFCRTNFTPENLEMYLVSNYENNYECL